MTGSATAALGLVCAALAVLGWLLVTASDPTRRRARANLQRGLVPKAGADGRAEPRTARDGVSGIARLAPGSVVRRLVLLRAKAGRGTETSVNDLLLTKVALTGVAALLGLAYLAMAPGALAVLLALVIVVVAHHVPELLLYSRGKERSDRIALELADTLDQMTIAVEAGLGFESAMAQVARNGRGPLAQELVRTLQDMQVGQTRRQAYEALALRTDVRDLRRFVSAVVQADAYGIAIADVLRTQAAEMRLKRRQRAEEKAMQIPVKVIFPLMVCILPVLFIVLLGPAAIDMMAAFG